MRVSLGASTCMEKSINRYRYMPADAALSCSSVDSSPRSLHHRRPLRDLALDEGAELLGRVRHEARAFARKAGLDLGRLHDAVHLGVPASDDVGRGAGGCEEGDPVVDLEARERLADGREL